MYYYLEFKLLYFKNLIFFSIGVKELFEHRVLWRKSYGILLSLRGYCTPDQFFDCLCIVFKNCNTLVTSKICFLEETFQGTQLLHWDFSNSSGYWFMAQNMENIDFRTFFVVTSQQWPLLKYNCDFWVPWNISDQIHRILCPNLLYFVRKCTKSSKIRPRGAVPP